MTEESTDALRNGVRRYSGSNALLGAWLVVAAFLLGYSQVIVGPIVVRPRDRQRYRRWWAPEA